MKVGRWIVLAAVIGGAAYYGAGRYERAHQELASVPAERGSKETVLPNRRIKVEVLNATTTRGLARRATLFLRDRGFDVVAIGTAAQQREETLVIDRSRHPEWARLIAEALDATVTSLPDSSRYVDATVLIGSNWRPPSHPFYP